MKGKKTTYVLIPVVLILWSIIGYKIYNATSDDVPLIQNSQPLMTIEVADTLNQDFTLVLNYSDPFFNEPVKSKPRQQTKTRPNTRAKVVAPKINQEISWPEIIYNGMIDGGNPSNKVGLLNVLGKSHLVKEGDVVADLRIANISADSIKIYSGENYKYFKK